MQFKEALVPAMVISSSEGGRNVQLFSGCRCVGLAGCSPLPTGLARGRLGSSGRLCHPERGHQPHGPRPRARQLRWAAVGTPESPALLPSAPVPPLREYEHVWAWVMGKISCLPPFPLCGAAIQSLRLGHVLISQDRDALQGTGRYPTHFSLMLCFYLPSLREG